MPKNDTPLAMQQAGEASGFDPASLVAYLQSLNWIALMAFIQSAIGLWKNRPKTAKGHHPDECCPADCKAHFTVIKEIAECGEHCCDCCPV